MGWKSALWGLALAVGLAGPVAAAPVAPKPLYRDPVYDGAADASIVYDHARSRWTMFYTNRRATMKLSDSKDVAWVHRTHIGTAVSQDGLAWRYDGVARFPAACTGPTQWAPELYYEGGLYHMWLTIVPVVSHRWGEKGAVRKIVHLTSPDLHRWSCGDTLQLGSDRVIDASLLKLTSGYRLWYKDEQNGSQIKAADSPDLKTWTKVSDIPVTQTPGEGPKVFRFKGFYWLIADAWKGLIVLRSTDATTWQQQGARLLETPGTRPTDVGLGQHPDVVVNGDRAFIYYFVHQGEAPQAASDPHWRQRTVIQVAELKFVDGKLDVDRDAEVDATLTPP